MACLQAAAARPRQSYGDQEAHKAFFEKVAALGHGIAATHCFGNGNKRTAFVAMLQMMHANGWTWNAPPDIVSFVMLRAASNVGRMDVKEIASFIGCYAQPIPSEGQKHISDGMVNRGYAAIILPDEFPAPIYVSQERYEVEATQALRKHEALMSGDERKEFEETFRWPVEMDRKIARWVAARRYKARVLRWHKQRIRRKRFGKRRCPHLGGRTVKRRH